MNTISERALTRRISRALSREDASRLCRTRAGSRAELDLGEWYVLSARNIATSTHVDLQDLGRELGVLQSHEQIEGAA
ncbi:hypothetical protein [Hydrogenophaga sp. BPS33]|uniref:hypothetical protein n=1 Tax=Hydrogenophaga sp. BPS33 TaxID=2651974 RepID=UPI00132005D0|nr:hypothetical protein [Hydrogenophaga sp. BPS33]QHE86509.1 hypothetical protein F9K07_17180 [Hydrogenophaga sp. BPS33]